MLDIYVSDGRISDGSSACIFFKMQQKGNWPQRNRKEARTKEIIRKKEMIWKRKRDDQGKKCPNKY
jgi:hypothetical protein